MKKPPSKTTVVTAKKRSADSVGKVSSEAAMKPRTAKRKESKVQDDKHGDDNDDDNDGENADDDDDDDEDVDQARALLQGLDSDTEDPAQDQGFNKDDPIPQLPDHKTTQIKARQAAAKTPQNLASSPPSSSSSSSTGVVYIGRIPHGFYEREMRQYFSQFGTISRLRLSRNRKTGRSKHFAFVEFESGEVAAVVAEAMDNYLMYGHIVKCRVVPAASLHPHTFKGANRSFKVVPHRAIERRALDAPRTERQWRLKNRREQARRSSKALRIQEAMGYQIELPELKGPAEVLARRADLRARNQPDTGISTVESETETATNTATKATATVA